MKQVVMSKKFLLIATFSLFSWVGGPSYAASCHGVVAIGYFNGVHVTPMYLERLPGDNGGRDPSGHGFVEIYLNNRFGESPGIAPYDQIKTYMDEFVNGKGLHGAWSGELVQENPRLVFPIKLNFRGVRGVSAAPTHNCHGRMRLVKQNGDVFVYSNHNIGCRKIVTDTIVTLHRDRQNLSGSWEPIFAFGSHVSGHAVLRKVADECSARGKNESF